MYGPYSSHRPFLEKISEVSLLNNPSLILARDLDLTLCPNEVWGKGQVVDPLVDYFNGLFEEAKLVDVIPHCLYPT